MHIYITCEHIYIQIIYRVMLKAKSTGLFTLHEAANPHNHLLIVRQTRDYIRKVFLKISKLSGYKQKWKGWMKG